MKSFRNNLEIFFPSTKEMLIFDASVGDSVPRAIDTLQVEIQSSTFPSKAFYLFNVFDYVRQDDELLKLHSDRFDLKNGFQSGIYEFKYTVNSQIATRRLLYYAPILEEVSALLHKLNTKVEIKELNVNYIPDVQDKINYDNLEQIRLVLALVGQLEFVARKLTFNIGADDVEVNDILMKLKRLLKIIENGTN